MNKYNTLDEQIVSMRLKGLIQREIAEELNITRDKVAYVLKKKSVTKPEYKRECRHCKEEFTTNNARKVNCSEVCRHRHNSRSKGSTYNCNYCGDKYKGYRVRDNCTQGCKEQERQDLYEKKKLLLRLTRAVDPKRQKDCLECGIRFHAKRRGSRYCSSRCNQTHYHRANYKPMEHNHKCSVSVEGLIYPAYKFYVPLYQNSVICVFLCVVLSAFMLLHILCASFTLPQVCVPPFTTGMTWSMLPK